MRYTQSMKSDFPNDSSGSQLIVETNPELADVRFLEESIDKFNTQATGVLDGKLFGLFRRAADGSPVAGAFGWTWGSTCYVRYLYVSKELRRQGLGVKLMRAVETEAISRGCRQIILETHSFQAPIFYQKLGFVVVGHADDYPKSHQYLLLVKQIC